MAEAGVFTLVFSSSATVYGGPSTAPITEDQLVGYTTNPYGRSKFMVELVLSDIAASDSRWRVALLRYFNPVEAHDSGCHIGRDPNGIPKNLAPYVVQVAVGQRTELAVFGHEYPTVDGAGVHDYINVVALAEGHLAALKAVDSRPGIDVWNLGSGQGYSVLQVVRASEAASGRTVPHRLATRRPGGVAICYARPGKASAVLNWTARRDLHTIMRDAWRWQSQNPHGYRGCNEKINNECIF